MFEIVFYGTSGWFDHETSGTSCAGVFLNDTDVILFDLGTGARKIKADLIRGKKLIVILSHLHLDHCYGLHILPMFQPASLVLVIHEDLKPYLEKIFSYPFMIPSYYLRFPVHMEAVNDSLIDYSRFSIKTKALQHNTPVIGAQLRFGKIAITYCVDTRLCDDLIDITKDCDILIIESSPSEGRKTNGYHLSLTGLRTVLKATNAEKVILTHFGPLQYPNIKSREQLAIAIKPYHNNIVMACDGLVIRN